MRRHRDQIDLTCAGECGDSQRGITTVSDPVDTNALEFIDQDLIEAILQRSGPVGRAVADNGRIPSGGDSHVGGTTLKTVTFASSRVASARTKGAVSSP